jgi:hypothetical protein
VCDILAQSLIRLIELILIRYTLFFGNSFQRNSRLCLTQSNLGMTGWVTDQKVRPGYGQSAYKKLSLVYGDNLKILESY